MCAGSRYIRYGGRWTSKDVQNGETSGKGRTEDEREAEVEQRTGQSQSSVHSLMRHTHFEFMFGRQITLLLDVMMGPKAMRKTTYCEFVSDPQDSLETAYCDVM